MKFQHACMYLIVRKIMNMGMDMSYLTRSGVPAIEAEVV